MTLESSVLDAQIESDNQLDDTQFWSEIMHDHADTDEQLHNLTDVEYLARILGPRRMDVEVLDCCHTFT